MRLPTLFATSAVVVAASAQYIGFNSGSTFTDGSAKQQSDFEAEFNRAKSLPGTNGEFTSARLYTMIQGGTTDTPISAIPAAIDTQTTLLLGLWASSGQADFTNELTALTSAISQYGTSFTSLIAAISVGSEDLYRNSPTGILANGYNGGAQPADIVNFIGQIRSAIAQTSASGLPIGHVDTWTAWFQVNGSNDAVITACDWLGMDAYPYFQNTIANSIDVANSTFFDAYDATVGVAQGKHVWVTETGWPVSGPQENQAVASTANAEVYWQDVACSLLGKINTWWYTLQDAAPTTPNPSFGIVGADLSSAPLYNLTCSNGNSPSSSAAASPSSSAASTVSSATAPASSAGPNTESVTLATPRPETSPASVSLSQTSGSAPQSSSAATTAATTASPVLSSSQTTLATVSSPSAGGSSPSPSASNGSCATSLSGEHQYPHLIIPVNSETPNTAYGTQYNGVINPTVSSIFNFDVPADYSGKTCSLVFLFPEQAALKTSAYTFNAQGGMSVNELSSPATQQTTYATVPAVVNATVGTIGSLKAGGSYVVASQECAAGQTVSYEFESTGGLDIKYFQNADPSAPIGVYITAC
ncbi:hypothetical protein B0A55_05174 [Friedmanniomyces simplex]|uniref:Probable glucan endo-1,3-beta-glucosidase eglC n=1 Tax=Friedmanniomyces simplex TaxID=329884 RepID=A0A4U0XGG1_9PEZI|nr:hypothetical protein B0A55_05174 [Friedmanniomyces simplex]